MTVKALGLLSILALTTAACASTGGQNSYRQDMDKLEQDCTSRGGILQPTGALTGRPETEYACRITTPTRISRD